MTDTLTSRKLLGEHGRNWRHYDEQGDHAPFADQPDPWIAFRTYRAISWLERAEREGADDMDASFIFLWIAFDAAYGSAKSGRRFAMDRFFQEILGADAENTIYTAIWERFSGPVRMLMGNPGLFQPYLDELNGEPSVADWSAEFRRRNRELTFALKHRHRTFATLSNIFDRLYTLRNQLMHGAAKWGSSRNRDSVRDARAIMAFLVPVFLNIMIESRQQLALGEPSYYLQGGGA